MSDTGKGSGDGLSRPAERASEAPGAGPLVFLRNLLAGVGTALLVLCAVEILLRLISAATGQNWTVDPLPSHRTEQVLLPEGDQLRFFKQHYSSPDEEERVLVFSPSPTRPRVIVIGESFVYGLGLDEEEAWPARLEEALGGEVEVLNFGRLGSYASQLVSVLEAAITLDPEVIILAIGNNEHTMTTFYSGWAGRYPDLVYAFSEALGTIRIYGLLHRVIVGPGKVIENANREMREFSNPVDEEIYHTRSRPPNLDAVPDLITCAEATDALEREQRLKERVFRTVLSRMVDAAEAREIRVILTTLPTDLTAPPNLSGIHEDIDEDDEATYRALMSKLLAGTEFSEIQRLAMDAFTKEQLSRFAHFQYALGRNLMKQGRAEEAAVSFRLALDWEMVPDITPSLNGIIREVADDKGCPLVDLDLQSDIYLSNPKDFFLDSVHVNEAGARVVAKEILPVLKAALRMD